MGDEIDLSEFKSKGIQPGEQLLPDDDQTEKIEQLVGLGFTRHQAKYSLDRLRGDINQAAEWLFMNAEEVPPELKEGKKWRRNCSGHAMKAKWRSWDRSPPSQYHGRKHISSQVPSPIIKFKCIFYFNHQISHKTLLG